VDGVQKRSRGWSGRCLHTSAGSAISPVCLVLCRAFARTRTAHTHSACTAHTHSACTAHTHSTCTAHTHSACTAHTHSTCTAHTHSACTAHTHAPAGSAITPVCLVLCSSLSRTAHGCDSHTVNRAHATPTHPPAGSATISSAHCSTACIHTQQTRSTCTNKQIAHKNHPPTC